MPTETLPRGWFIATDLADGTLFWGDTNEIYGDSIPAAELAGLVTDVFLEAGYDQCEECGGVDNVYDVNGDDEPRWLICEDCRDAIGCARDERLDQRASYRY